MNEAIEHAPDMESLLRALLEQLFAIQASCAERIAGDLQAVSAAGLLLPLCKLADLNYLAAVRARDLGVTIVCRLDPPNAPPSAEGLEG